MFRNITINVVSVVFMLFILSACGVGGVNSPASNKSPTASSVSITDDNGGDAYVGDTLTGNYIYNDAEGDVEGVTTFRWLRNGLAIGGATASTYTLVASDEGQTIFFEVTPVAAKGTTIGNPVLSVSIEVLDNSAIINHIPTASNVTITDDNGGDASVGDSLTGNYTYNDEESDEEGVTTFRWLRNGAAISGAIASTYTLVLADRGQPISFEVTPIAKTGLITGSAVVSDVITVISNIQSTVTSLGPGGGSIESIAVSPANEFVGFAGSVNGGIFKTTDGATSWTWSGLGGETVNDIAINPSNTNIIYAGTSTGLFKSADNGSTWSNIDNNESYSVLIDLADSNVVYSGTSNGVRKSTDSGDTWVAASTGLNSIVFDLAMGFDFNHTLYAACNDGLFISIDDAASWTQTVDATATLVDTRFNAVAVSVSNPDRIYLAGYTSPDANVYTSSDGGASWIVSNLQYVNSIAIDPTDANIAYAASWASGTYKTIDGGVNWNLLTTGDVDRGPKAIAIAPGNTNRVYVGHFRTGIYFSADAAASWNDGNNGLNASNIAAIVPDPVQANQYYIAATSKGFFKTPDLGNTLYSIWPDTNSMLFIRNGVWVDPLDTQHIIAGTTAGGYYVTSNGGTTWSAETFTTDYDYISVIASDPQDATILYMASSQGLFLKSTDSGATWNPSDTGLSGNLYSITFDPNNSNTLYLAGDNGIFKSINTGSNWSLVSDTMTNATRIIAASISPTDPTYLYVVTGSTLHVSADDGVTWSNVEVELETATTYITFDKNDPNILYAATGGGIYRSADNAQSWTLIDASLSSTVNLIQVDPNDSNVLLVGVSGGGLWRINLSL